MSDEREQIAQLQETWMRAWIDLDVPTCERLLAAGFRLRSAATDDIVDRREWLRQLEAGRVRATGFSHDEMDVAVLGDTAVTMSRITQQAEIEGRDWSATLNVTDVWVRGDGGWQVVARHASPPVGHGGPMSS